MGLPNINVTFSTLARELFIRGSKGTLCMILKDTGGIGEYVITSAEDIPDGISADNKAVIERTLIGNVTSPDRIICNVMDAESTIDEGLVWAELQAFDYLVGPADIAEPDTTAVVEWIKKERAANKKVKAILPETAADCEGIVNFSASGIKTADGTFTAAQYCSRIAGIIAGTPFTQAATYVELPEVIDAARMSRAEADKAIEEGKFIIWYDSRKFKTGRAVNSLVTLTDEKGEAFTKIKIVEVMDLIKQDIILTAEDQFIGKYPNSYDNRCLLISAIKGYFDDLVRDAILGPNPTIGIDINANRAWLKEHKIDVSAMTDEEIKVANTGSVVNLTATIQILDVIEDINLPILLNQ